MSSKEEQQKLIKPSDDMTINISDYGSKNEEETKTEDVEKKQIENKQHKEEEDLSQEDLIKIFAGKHHTYDSFLKTGAGLDIYQLVAFQRIAQPEIRFIGEYGLNVFKALICLFTQVASVAILFHYAFNSVKPASGRGWCDQTGDMEAYLMAIAYTTFLSLILWSNVTKQRKGGFYKYYKVSARREYLNKFVCKNWLTFGQFVNNCTVLSAFVLSFLIIFFGNDPMHIILSAVALLFIADIDNMVISPDDYKDTLKWFKDIHNANAYADVNALEKRKGINERLCTWLCFTWSMIHIFLHYMQYLVDGIACILGISIPIFVMVCY